jgi:hypothetical protein
MGQKNGSYPSDLIGRILRHELLDSFASAKVF